MVGIGTTTPWGLLSVNSNDPGLGVPEFTIGSTTATHFVVLANGNTGVGTTSPWAQFSVNPNALGVGVPEFVVGSTTATHFIIDKKGNVGIGTTTPGTLFSINSVANFTTGTSTFVSTGGINLKGGGCFAINGTCMSDMAITRQTFISNGTYTPSAGLLYVSIECMGGGGGGGGATGASGSNLAGGGGGGGGYSRRVASSTAIGGSQTVTIGGGGGGGNPGNGTLGNDTTVGTLCVAKGGTGGVGATTANVPGGGAGGAAGTGDFAASGPRGEYGYNSTQVGVLQAAGSGASTQWGTGGVGGSAGGGATDNGVAGSLYGSGGGGGSEGNVAANASGGAGAAGVVIITEYVNSSLGGGSDYAEMFPVSSPDIGAGDIVSADTGQPVSLKLSQNGDKAIVGVISTAPGQVIGETDVRGMRPLALSGRVPAKVSHENGGIKIGDRITLSTTAGVGMRANLNDASVGIALEDYNSGSSGSGKQTIMIFVNIQRGIDNYSSANDFSSTTEDMFTALTLSTTTASTTSVTTLAGKFFSNLFARITSWFADIANGIGDIFANRFRAKEELCIGETCVNEAQLKSLLQTGSTASPVELAPLPDSGSASSTSPTSGDSEPPVLQLIGNATSSINIGDSYVDPGATVTDNVDHNLGVVIIGSVDTSTAGDYTLTYSAEDSAGNKAIQLVRVVTVVNPNPPSETVVPTESASSTPGI